MIYPDESALTAAPGLVITALCLIFSLWQIMANTVLEACGKIKNTLLSTVFASIVKLLSAYYFIGLNNYGILGAPISTVLFHFSGFLISILFVIRIKNVMFKVLYYSLPTILISFISIYTSFQYFHRSSQINQFEIRFAVSCIIAVILYLGIYYFTHIIVKSLQNSCQNKQKNASEIIKLDEF